MSSKEYLVEIAYKNIPLICKKFKEYKIDVLKRETTISYNKKFVYEKLLLKGSKLVIQLQIDIKKGSLEGRINKISCENKIIVHNPSYVNHNHDTPVPIICDDSEEDEEDKMDDYSSDEE